MIRKSRIDVIERMIARFVVGSPSWINKIVKLALMPPGTGGAAADRIMQTIKAVTIHVTEVSAPLLAAELMAANQKRTEAPGL